MAEKPSPRDMLAEVMAGGRQVIVPYLAEHLKRRGIRELQAAEQRRRFWQAAISDEQEQQMWRDAMLQRGITELVPGSPEAASIGLDISKAKYPDRWDMLPGEGRDTESKQSEWAWKMARRGPPPQQQEGTDAPTEA